MGLSNSVFNNRQEVNVKLETVKLFQVTESIIKSDIKAEAVRIRLKSISRFGLLYFECYAIKDRHTYLQTPPLILQQFYLRGPSYITRNLYQIDGGVDLFRAQKYLANLKPSLPDGSINPHIQLQR